MPFQRRPPLGVGLGIGGRDTRPTDPKVSEAYDAHSLEPDREIKRHVKGALNNGITVEEIKAELLHTIVSVAIFQLSVPTPTFEVWRADHVRLSGAGKRKD